MISVLENRDYTIIIDKSGSMSTVDSGYTQTRWELVQESTLALARKCEQVDPDKLTLYLFSGKFKRYDGVTAADVEQVFKENEPMGSTNLEDVLRDALSSFFYRKNNNIIKEGGETILVVTDGQPNDRKGVMRLIIEASRKLDFDEELAISFVQVGTDPTATQFLKALDDELQGVGAKFDIVDTVTFEDMGDMTITEVLLNAIKD